MLLNNSKYYWELNATMDVIEININLNLKINYSLNPVNLSIYVYFNYYNYYNHELIKYYL